MGAFPGMLFAKTGQQQNKATPGFKADVEMEFTSRDAYVSVIKGGRKTKVQKYDAKLLKGPKNTLVELKGNYLALFLTTSKGNRLAMLPHNILGLLSPTFIRLRSEWEMPWSPCVCLNYAQNPAPLRLPQMAGRLFGMQFLPPSRATSALRISELPCRLPGTKNHHSA